MSEKTKAPKLDLSDMTTAEAIASLNKLYGDGTMILASEAEGSELKFVSTGCYKLDFSLGGGFPENRIIEIRGPFSSFKSTISLMSAKSFLKRYADGLVIYVDVEKSFDRKYARKLGLDMTRVAIVNPDSGEQAVNVVGHLFSLNRPTWIIIDSIAALVPSAEIVSEAEQQTIGLQARLVNKLMRLATARLKRNLYSDSAPSATVLCLNQLRQKITMFGDPETTPGGVGKDFAYSVILRMASKKANLIAKDVEVNGVKHSVKYGQVVEYKVIKNKCGGPQHEEGEFTYWYKDYEEEQANTFDNLEALFHFGAFNDIITFDSNGYHYQNLRAAKPGNFKKLLRKNPNHSRTLYKEILEQMRGIADDVEPITEEAAPQEKKKVKFKFVK